MKQTYLRVPEETKNISYGFEVNGELCYIDIMIIDVFGRFGTFIDDPDDKEWASITTTNDSDNVINYYDKKIEIHITKEDGMYYIVISE